MSSVAKFLLALIGVILLLAFAGSGVMLWQRSRSTQPTPTPLLTPLSSPTPEANTNPFDPSALNPFEDDTEATNPFTSPAPEAEEAYVNPFSDL